MKQYRSFVRDFLKGNVYDICSNYCPHECETIDYVVHMNTEQLPVFGNISEKSKSFEYSALFKTFENVQKHYIQVKAYFHELKFTFISQQPKTGVVDLVSNIGGTLGLFLGISFLSSIEIIELIIEILFVIFKK